MAVQDPTKKKRELIPTTGAVAPDYGQPQGGGGGGVGSPGAAATPAAPDPVGYGAGAALRESAKNVAIQGGLAAAKATAPYLKSVIAEANFLRGLAGASPGAIARPVAQTPSINGAGSTGQPAAVQPATRVLPAGAAPVPGGTAPAGGGTPVAPPAAPILRPGDVNTFTGNNGVTRAVPGLNAQPGSVNTQSFGGATTVPAAIARPTYSAGPAAPAVASTYGLPVNDPRLLAADSGLQRPDTAFRGADATAEAYNSREDREARQKLASDLGDEMFRLRVGGLNSRSKRQAFADLAGQRAQLVGGGEKLSADANANRNTHNTTLANTGLEQAGANQRAALEQTGAYDRAALQDAGETARAQAALSRPTTVTAADGTLLNVDAGRSTAAPIKLPDGTTVTVPMAADKSGQITPKDVLTSLTDQLKAEQSAVQPNPDTIANLQQQISSLTSGANGVSGAAAAPVPAGMKIVGTSGGKPVYEDANGKRFTY